MLSAVGVLVHFTSLIFLVWTVQTLACYYSLRLLCFASDWIAEENSIRWIGHVLVFLCLCSSWLGGVVLVPIKEEINEGSHHKMRALWRLSVFSVRTGIPRHAARGSRSLSMLLIERIVSLSILDKFTINSTTINSLGERVFAAWGWHLTYSVSLFTSLTQGTDLIRNERICKVVGLQGYTNCTMS